MPIFFILHSLMPSAKDSDINEGQRNSILFLMGMFFM